MIVGVFVCVFGDCPLQIGPFLPVTILHSHLISHRFRAQSLSPPFIFFILFLISLFFILTKILRAFTEKNSENVKLFS